MPPRKNNLLLLREVRHIKKHHRTLKAPLGQRQNLNNHYLDNVKFSKMDIREQSHFEKMKQNRGFEEGQDRIGFVRKVYGILSCCLILTSLMASVPLFDTQMRHQILGNQWLLWVSVALALFIQFTLLCFRSIARLVPINYFLLLTFTLCESYIIMFTASYSEPQVVLIAAIFTAAMVIALTVYAFQTKRDFSYCGASIAILGSVMLVFGIMLIFFKSSILVNTYCSLSVIVFGFYLVYHTQLVIGGGRYELSDEDYILGVLIIYLDIIMIFTHLVKLLSRRD